jgi:hypothetical protein
MDLATIFLQRCLDFSTKGGAVGTVTPQNWLFLTSYQTFRERLLRTLTWRWIARLGPKGFQTPMWDFNVQLSIVSVERPADGHDVAVLDVGKATDASSKSQELRMRPVATVVQKTQLENPDARFTFEAPAAKELLRKYADCFAGIQNGDAPRFQRFFWEISNRDDLWHFQQATVPETILYGGREQVIFFDKAEGHLREEAAIRRTKLHDSDQRGNQAWDKAGVVVSQMNELKVTLYTGELYDQSCAVILPYDQRQVAAVWAFCSSQEFNRSVRQIDQKLNVTNSAAESELIDGVVTRDRLPGVCRFLPGFQNTLRRCSLVDGCGVIANNQELV